MGFNALTDNTGGYNVAVGYGALANNTTGNFNMAIGAEALTKTTPTSTWPLVFEWLLHEHHRQHLTRNWRCSAQEQHNRAVLTRPLVPMR